MSGRETIALSDIERIKAELEQIGPPKRQTASKQQAIAALKAPIEKMLKLGYRLQEIAKELEHNGLSVSVGVLRVYLKQAQGGKRRGAKPAPKGEAEKSALAKSAPPERAETDDLKPEAP